MSDAVSIHRSEACFEGYTLLCESYEDPSANPDGTGKIHLVDMAGEPVHTWRVDTALQSFCQLLPNGNLLYPTRDRSRIDEAGVRELTPGGEVVRHYHCRVDHDLSVLENGTLLIHTIIDRMIPAVGPGLKRDPYLLEVTSGGELVWEWHGGDHFGDLEACLDAKEWAYVRERIDEEYPFDWAHNNTAQVIPPNESYEAELDQGVDRPRFAPGNIVFSYRSLDVIGVIDRDSGEIVWTWGPGSLDGQHLPHVLPNGNVLLFDNGTRRGYSRVLELDPLTETVEWEYTGSPKESFFSAYISGAQRLPNGNTLICEGGEGHVFEVTPEDEVVWDFVSPFGDEASLGSVYRATRYTPEYVAPLLSEDG